MYLTRKKCVNLFLPWLGYHLWGMDLRLDDNPIEAGLKFICRNNGDYMGKASVDECHTNGIKKRLVHLHVNE